MKTKTIKTKRTNLFKTLIFISIISATLFLSACESQEDKDFSKSYTNYNEAFKKVLFATGQNKSESSELMTDFEIKWNEFYNTYKANPIKPYSQDADWAKSLDAVDVVVVESRKDLTTGDLLKTHKTLENIRPIWQDIFVRNKISTRGFYMTEFHDLMEVASDAAKVNDFEKITNSCPKLNELWAEVKSQNSDIKESSLSDFNEKSNAEQKNINLICGLAENKTVEGLPDAGSNLKTGFIKVYLIYG